MICSFMLYKTQQFPNINSLTIQFYMLITSPNGLVNAFIWVDWYLIILVQALH